MIDLREGARLHGRQLGHDGEHPLDTRNDPPGVRRHEISDILRLAIDMGLFLSGLPADPVKKQASHGD